jgi:hypothetical protein
MNKEAKESRCSWTVIGTGARQGDDIIDDWRGAEMGRHVLRTWSSTQATTAASSGEAELIAMYDPRHGHANGSRRHGAAPIVVDASGIDILFGCEVLRCHSRSGYNETFESQVVVAARTSATSHAGGMKVERNDERRGCLE